MELFQVMFGNIECFVFDMMSIVGGASMLFYIVAPLFLKDEEDEQPKKDENAK